MGNKKAAVVLGAVLLAVQSAGLCGCANVPVETQTGSQAYFWTETAEEDGRKGAEADMRDTVKEPDGVGGQEPETGRQPDGAGTDRLAGQETEPYEDGANGFALRFTGQMLAQAQEGENLILSPYSVWLPLAALTQGTTEAQREPLLAALGVYGMDLETLHKKAGDAVFALTKKEQAEWAAENGQDFQSPLRIANAMFVGKGEQVRPDFADIFAETYQGKLFTVDFLDPLAVSEVNDWAKEQTEGKITKLVDAFSPDTVAAIANAVYFSDGWVKEFPRENTHPDVFYGADGQKEVPFMQNRCTGMPYYEDSTMQAASLNTAGGGRLILLLPKEGKQAEQLLADMDTEAFAKIADAQERTVQLSLPPFRIESGTFSVKEALECMGIPLMDQENPCLTGVLEGEALAVSEAVQKALIEVDEKGMTAAAATAVMMERCSLIEEQEPVEMKCDRPFSFLVTAYDGGGQQILFAGVVNTVG